MRKKLNEYFVKVVYEEPGEIGSLYKSMFFDIKSANEKMARLKAERVFREDTCNKFRIIEILFMDRESIWQN